MQLDFVPQKTVLKVENELITDFVVCFYATWYLESSNVLKTRFLDMKAIHQMHQYKDICLNPVAFDAALDSLYKHTLTQLYLDSTMIPLAFFGSPGKALPV